MKIYQLLYLNLCILLISLSQVTRAQLFVGSKNKLADVELWNGIGIGKELNDQIDFSFSYQLRFNQQIQRFKSTFAQVGISFPIRVLNQKVKISPNFRVIRTFDKEIIKRPLFELSTDLFKSEILSIDYRMRFQKDFENFNTDEFDFDFYWRNRFLLSFERLGQAKILKDIEPYLGFIFFTRAYYKGSYIDQVRLFTGISYQVKKRQSIKLGYIYREKINESDPSISHLIIFKIDFELKDFKK